MSSKLDLIYEKYNENKMSHIFLIESNDIEASYESLKQIITKIINSKDKYDVEDLLNKINNGNILDYYVLEPENGSIKKEQIVSLFDNCKTLPMYLSDKYYVIKYAEKINENGQNRILKFIEEPTSGIYGFLICSDTKKLLETIVSRCQRIIDYHQVDDDYDFLNDELIINYVNNIETNPNILLNNELMENISDRINYIDFFTKLNKIYTMMLNGNSHLNDNYKIIKKLNIKALCDRITLTNEIINRLSANCNIRLVLNYFVLEMRNLHE